MKFDAVVIGGGTAAMTVAGMLCQGGLRCAVVSKGTSLGDKGAGADFSAAGGVIFRSDSVTAGSFDGDGKLTAVSTEKLGKDALQADWFVLASGKYFSKGILVGMDTVRESIFGCDLYYEQDRSKWFDPDFYARQPFMGFGVITDRQGRVSIDGHKVPNLYAAGEILKGVDGSDPKSEKLIQKSAVRAAEYILKDAGKNDKR